ncbi:MAG: PH domain-containing protein [Syntrophobacteraceae bacterium]
MSYIENNLMNGENILYRARLHWVVFFWPVIWFVVAIVFFSRGGDVAVNVGRLLILIAIVKAISSTISFSTSEFAVTNQRVIAKVGFIRRNSLEVLLGKIEAIQVNQDISGRILGYGSITVSGTGGTRDPFHNISNPLELRRKIQEQVVILQKP